MTSLDVSKWFALIHEVVELPWARTKVHKLSGNQSPIDSLSFLSEFDKAIDRKIVRLP